MSWLNTIIQKEARRYRTEDRVRFFTDARKGQGKGIVLTPNFRKGLIRNYDAAKKRYEVSTEDNQRFMVHPRNIMPETIQQNSPPQSPATTSTPQTQTPVQSPVQSPISILPV